MPVPYQPRLNKKRVFDTLAARIFSRTPANKARSTAAVPSMPRIEVIVFGGSQVHSSRRDLR
jgi:hypothetical protein